MGLFDEVLKPSDGNRIAMQRDLERRRSLWVRPDYVYRGAGDLLLRHGQFYSGREVPGEYSQYVGGEGKCFLNALAAAEQDSSLRYCEGIYSPGASGVYSTHAWCIAPDGGVVELTYPTTEVQRFRDPRSSDPSRPITPVETWGYWGVIVHVNYARHHRDTLSLPMLDRDRAEQEEHAERGGDPADVENVHDFPILKVPYDPDRRSL